MIRYHRQLWLAVAGLGMAGCLVVGERRKEERWLFLFLLEREFERRFGKRRRPKSKWKVIESKEKRRSKYKVGIERERERKRES